LSAYHRSLHSPPATTGPAGLPAGLLRRQVSLQPAAPEPLSRRQLATASAACPVELPSCAFQLGAHQCTANKRHGHQRLCAWRQRSPFSASLVRPAAAAASGGAAGSLVEAPSIDNELVHSAMQRAEASLPPSLPPSHLSRAAGAALVAPRPL
jgi:hypothetical protein